MDSFDQRTDTSRLWLCDNTLLTHNATASTCKNRTHVVFQINLNEISWLPDNDVREVVIVVNDNNKMMG